MAQVTVNVHARVVERDLRNATRDVQRHLHQAGRDAGNDFGAQLATGIERSTPRVNKALDSSTSAVDRVRAAEERLARAWQSGDREAVITATNKLARAHELARTEVDRLAKSQQRLSSSLNGGGLQSVDRDVRSLSGSVAALGQQFSGLGRAAGPVAIAALVPAIGALAGAAAQATGVIGLLPGVLGGAVAAFGTAKIATLGFSDALENISDPEKFREALLALSPAAQQVALSIKAMMPAFDELKNATQDSFFANIAPQVNSTVNALLPQIQQLTTGVAGGMNQMLSGVMSQLTSPEGMATIQSTVANLVTGFQNLAPAAAPFTQAIMQLVNVGSSFFPQMASAITEGAQAFAQFIDEASRSGQLQEWIQGGIAAMRELGPITMSVLKTLLSMAPIGERVLPIIADTLELIADAMPPIAELTARFSPLFITWSNAVTLVSGAFDGVAAAANAVITVVNAVAAAIDAMLGPVRQAIDLANRLPGMNLPNIPSIPQISQGGSAPQGGGPNASRERRGLPPVESSAGISGIPDGGYQMPTRPGDNWWLGAGVGNPSEFQREQYRSGVQDMLSPSGGGAGGGSGPVAPYTGDPMELLKGFQVDSQLYASAGAVLDARQRRAQAEAELNATLADNEATAEERQKARNDLAKADRELTEAEMRLNEAKANATKQFSNQVREANSSIEGLLDDDLGLSRGLSGLVENMFRGLVGGLLSPITDELKRISGEGPGGHGLLGMIGQQNLANGRSPILGNPLPVNPAGNFQTGYPNFGSSNPNVNQMMALAQHADDGQYSWGGTDLVNGLADCSGAVSELVSVLTGRGTGQGRLFNTDSFPAYAQQNGWQRGYTPGGMNVGVRHGGPGGGHMAATLPNGVNFESGGSGIQYGGPAAGALDFPEVWSLPVGGGSMLPGMGMPQGYPMAPYGGAAPFAGGSPMASPMSPVGGGPTGMPQYGSRAPGEGGWQPSGGGFNGIGGLSMAAASSAISAAGGAGAPFGGQAAAAGAETAMQLISRAIGYGGQVAAIGASGLLETFGLHDSALGDPNKSWLGRMFAGFSGAKPATPATAGQTETPMAQQDAKGGAQAGLEASKHPQGPTVNIESFVQAENRNGIQTANDLAFRTHAAAGTGR